MAPKLTNWKNTLEKVLSGEADQNLNFDDYCRMLLRCGYTKRHGKGSHIIFSKPGFPNLVVQDRNGKVKGYQVSQGREQLKQQNLK